MHARWICTDFGTFAIAFGCSAGGGSLSKDDDLNAGCIPGESAMCACPDGTTSEQGCNPEGTYEPCPCAGDLGAGGAPVATGGSFPGSGGVIDVSGGGATATGGVTVVDTGGVAGSGGSTDTGGAPATGGVDGTGAVPGTGGLGSTGGTAATCPAPPGGQPALAVEAWTAINEARLPAGAGCMNLVAALTTSSQSHCDYLALHGNDSSCVPDTHSEVAGCTGFTGVTASAREIAAGYPSGLAYTEVANTYGNNPVGAIASWLATVWHRIPLLDPWTTDMGYGGAVDCDIMDIGRGVSSVPADAIVMFPYDGQTGVPPTFNGIEGPPPPVPAGGWPSSYPVSIYAQGISVTEHVLTRDGDGTPLEHVWLDAQSNLVSSGLKPYFTNTAMLYGAPFEPSTTYRVRVAGVHTGGAFSVEWTFTTGASQPWGL